jgi:hypothetical protein
MVTIGMLAVALSNPLLAPGYEVKSYLAVTPRRYQERPPDTASAMRGEGGSRTHTGFPPSCFRDSCR